MSAFSSREEFNKALEPLKEAIYGIEGNLDETNVSNIPDFPRKIASDLFADMEGIVQVLIAIQEGRTYRLQLEGISLASQEQILVG
jgi:hypothetical protein